MSHFKSPCPLGVTFQGSRHDSQTTIVPYFCVSIHPYSPYLSFLLLLLLTHTQLTFTITGEQMQLYTTKWEIPPGVMGVAVGGQQPGQKTQAPSNTLEGSFTIQG